MQSPAPRSHADTTEQVDEVGASGIRKSGSQERNFTTEHTEFAEAVWSLGFGASLELGAWDLELPDEIGRSAPRSHADTADR